MKQILPNETCIDCGVKNYCSVYSGQAIFGLIGARLALCATCLRRVAEDIERAEAKDHQERSVA